MNDELAEMYSEWLAEQNLVKAWDYAEEHTLRDDSPEILVTPDWSTWCQQLCS